ncbi:hypothetical protein CIL06_17310 [Pantoea vagans]|uniref:hypothetical protein n=1 Tax=Pantoea vagans TaxID=470934 RepID=UPI000BACD845|nr:hypothetical protein [Pantoea vagans]PAW37361.1 hypothetical protein CIL06_17310 [Pantoea vagans]
MQQALDFSPRTVQLLQEIDAWESMKLIKQYSDFAPNYLTEHARQIDAIFGSRVPNLSHVENLVAGGKE